jgi:hypothetical protein
LLLGQIIVYEKRFWQTLNTFLVGKQWPLNDFFPENNPIITAITTTTLVLYIVA